MRRPARVLCLAVAALLVVGAPPFVAPAAAASGLAPRLLVRFTDGITPDERAAAIRAVGGVAGGEIRAIGYLRVTLPLGADSAAAARTLASEAAVRAVEPDALLHTEYIPNNALWNDDPYTGLGQWAWRKTFVDRAWDTARGSPSIVVATIDTGVDPGHPDLAGVLLPGATFMSAASAVCPPSDIDDNSHGTHIAGIIAATGTNGIGISGVAFGVRILPVKALDCTGSGSTSDIAQGIVWATDHGARVINISLGTTYDSSALDAAVRYALDRGVLVVAAAGNCGLASGRCFTANVPEYPAAYPGVLAVGATDTQDNVTAFSTEGPQVAVSAPGVRIVSTTPRYATYLSERGQTVDYAAFSGTSQASAFVAGVAALLWSAQPSLTARQLFERLTTSADDLGAPGRDDAYGAGRVNAMRAVQPLPDLRGYSVSFSTTTPSELARKIAIDAQTSNLGRLLRGPLVIGLVNGETITLR